MTRLDDAWVQFLHENKRFQDIFTDDMIFLFKMGFLAGELYRLKIENRKLKEEITKDLKS